MLKIIDYQKGEMVVGAGFEPANGYPNGFTVRAL